MIKKSNLKSKEEIFEILWDIIPKGSKLTCGDIISMSEDLLYKQREDADWRKK